LDTTSPLLFSHYLFLKYHFNIILLIMILKNCLLRRLVFKIVAVSFRSITLPALCYLKAIKMLHHIEVCCFIVLKAYVCKRTICSSVSREYMSVRWGSSPSCLGGLGLKPVLGNMLSWLRLFMIVFRHSKQMLGYYL
jgi:hypothetical protein